MKSMANTNNKSSFYHEYAYQTTLCKTSDFDIDQVFKIMLSSTQFIAPTDDKQIVTDGMIVNVNVLMTKHNPVIVSVIPKMYSIINTTLPAHILHPGSVTRKLIKIADSIVIDTQGIGSGTLQGASNYLPLNIIMGYIPQLPRKYTPSGAINNIAAALVWGGVDVLLKKRIENIHR